jgi:hypothetical protein
MKRDMKCIKILEHGLNGFNGKEQIKLQKKSVYICSIRLIRVKKILKLHVTKN